MDALFELFQILAWVKAEVRVGWNDLTRRVTNAETVGCHSFGMVGLVIGLQYEFPHLASNWGRLMMIAVTHDIAEIITRDINVHILEGEEKARVKALKKRLEYQAICEIRGNLGPGLGDHIYELCMEYEIGQSPEARLAKELDKIEVMLQALHYYSQGQQVDPWEFWGNSREAVHTPELIEFMEAQIYPRLPPQKK